MRSRPFIRARDAATAAAVVVLLSLAVSLPAATAAPPANDAFTSAQAIGGMSGAVSGTNVEATKEPGEPDHADDDGGRSIWYRWTAPVADEFLFDTCESSFDTLLAVYTGETLQTLSTVAASDDACGSRSAVVVRAVAGTTYSIAVDGYEDGDVAAGTVALRWRAVTPPANDDFASAQEVTGISGSVAGDNLKAGAEAGEPRSANGVGASIWYRWTPPFTGTAAFDTCESRFDTVLTVYEGSAVATLTPVARNDDACGSRSRVRFIARAGTVYTIAVDGTGERPRGLVTFSWMLVRHPANDDFATSLRITGARGSVAGTNEGALAEANEPAHAQFRPNASLWYRWSAPRTMGVTFETCVATFDTLLAVYRGSTLRRLAPVDDNDDGCSDGRGSRLNFFARKGVEYRIAVDGLGSGNLGHFVLRWAPAGPSAGRCLVPDVRGEKLVRARYRLERADCLAGRIVYTTSAIVPAGSVIAQFPPPGRRLPFLSRVGLEVSRGRGR